MKSVSGAANRGQRFREGCDGVGKSGVTILETNVSWEGAGEKDLGFGGVGGPLVDLTIGERKEGRSEVLFGMGCFRS
jgi:hypothetical protein